MATPQPYSSLRIVVGGSSSAASTSTPSPRGPPPGVALVELATRHGALTTASFADLPAALAALSANPAVRAIVLASAAKHFCTGADLAALAGAAAVAAPRGGSGSAAADDPAAGRAALLALIRSWQAAFTALETCAVPVVAAVHGACVGAGVDLVTAADVRVAAPGATFCVKEVDLGIVADLGTLQRLRLLVGDGVARDWALTARTVDAAEAVRAGLVSFVAPDVREAAFKVAAGLATKPPRALAGTKAVLLAARDQTVAVGLEWVALWNGGGALPSAEVAAALGKARARL